MRTVERGSKMTFDGECKGYRLHYETYSIQEIHCTIERNGRVVATAKLSTEGNAWSLRYQRNELPDNDAREIREFLMRHTPDRL